jgi:hypothetical protein
MRAWESIDSDEAKAVIFHWAGHELDETSLGRMLNDQSDIITSKDALALVHTAVNLLRPI